MTLSDALQHELARRLPLAAADDRTALLAGLVDAGLDRLPRPGHGDTLSRWQALAAVAAADLSLCKLYEGHTDALAILAELGDAAPPHTTWGTWAAEAPGARVIASPTRDGRWRLDGRKAWCSGADGLSHALLTVWQADGSGPWLARVALRQPGVQTRSDGWQAVGMQASTSIDVHFEGATADLVGPQRAYLERPGFWHGGAGIAACWHGAAVAIAEALRRAVAGRADAALPFRRAALGQADVALVRTAALLREAAAWIDAHRQADAMAVALRCRLAAEDSAQAVLQLAGRALGAAPFCRDAHFARLAADLPVYLRQSHAEQDLAALGQALATEPEHHTPWSL